MKPAGKHEVLKWFGCLFGLLCVVISAPFMILREFMPYDRLPLYFILSMLGYIAMASGVCTAVIYFMARKHLLRPIFALNRAAKQIARGDFSVYVEPAAGGRFPELRELVASVNAMTEELASNEMLKSDFIANVSHEIKTPLAVIQNYSFAIQREDLEPERRREYTETIIAASKRLNTLVGNILKLNKLEHQEAAPNRQSYDLCEQLSDCILLFEAVMDDKNLAFEAELEDRAPITADREMLDLVWTNLLSNAFKFTEPGGSVRVCQTSDGGQYRVTVSDTGCGMDEKTLKRMFEKFYQGDTSHSKEGNGLGLALVSRILQLSGGTLEVESTPCKGTRFLIRIPRM